MARTTGTSIKIPGMCNVDLKGDNGRKRVVICRRGEDYATAQNDESSE